MTMAQDKTGNEERKTLTIMAHDIKAPLSAVLSILGVIEKDYVNDIDKVKELVSRAIQKTKTIIAMVNDILDYSLLADKSMMKREPVHIFSLLEDSLTTMKPIAKNMNIILTYDRDAGRGKHVSGSYTFLLRAFNNIIMNAIKYNKKNGKVAVNCWENTEKHTITIAVSDTGIGIPEDERDKVFHVFVRGKYARKNIDGSLGLGLSLVKQIIEDHDGEIKLTSTVGVGTTITVTLPLLNVNEKTEEQNEL
jgi:two-component system phosphate regulon sensor histidine kinase PhoR